MINFVLSRSSNYRQVQEQLLNEVKRHLAEGSWRESVYEYTPGYLNFSLFINAESDVLMSHGAADKNYHWRKSETGRRLNNINRRSHLLVPGPWLKNRIVRSKWLEFDEDSVHVVGWPRLDCLLQMSARDSNSTRVRDRIRVLWAPTHDYARRGDDKVSMSSYPEFEQYLPELRRRFDVDVSLHPRNRKSKVPTDSALLEADVVISDFGTLVYEAVALGKQVIFPSWIIKERILKYLRRSAEYEIFANGFGLHAESIDHLIDIVERRSVHSKESKKFFDDYLPPETVGRSGLLVADRLRRLSELPRRRGYRKKGSYTQGADRRGESPIRDVGSVIEHVPRFIRKSLAYDVADDLLLDGEEVPLTWWVNQPNFGDLLSPWLVQKMTGRSVVFNDGSTPCYIGIGSVLKRVTSNSVVWGTGSFGTESKRQVSRDASYLAVRGPLTRAKLINAGVKCPEVYGDPAILVPFFYWPDVEKDSEVGVVLRWSERAWNAVPTAQGVKKIFLKADNVEEVLRQILGCKRIISSSLHGLIIADAYGIPNAWLASHTPKGGEFKFFDYFISVDKVRRARAYDFAKLGMELTALLKTFDFDGREIRFDYEALLDACPFVVRRGGPRRGSAPVRVRDGVMT